MSAYLLHQGATVFCLHAGQVQATAPNPRVKLSGQSSVKQPDPWSVAACPFTTGGNPQPCITAQWTTAATRIKSGGQPLLLRDSQAVCTPNGTGVNIVTTQTRVKGA